MNPFETATRTIMSNPDFTDTAEIAGATVTVVASELAAGETLTEYGDDAASISIPPDWSTGYTSNLLRRRGLESWLLPLKVKP